MFKLFKHLFKQEEEHKRIAAEASKAPVPEETPPPLTPIYSIEIQAVLDDYAAHPELWFINPQSNEARKYGLYDMYLRRKLVAIDFCLGMDSIRGNIDATSYRYEHSYSERAYWVNPPPDHIGITFAEAKALHKIYGALLEKHKAAIAAKFREDILASLAVTEQPKEVDEQKDKTTN